MASDANGEETQSVSASTAAAAAASRATRKKTGVSDTVPLGDCDQHGGHSFG
ncbi:MAG: hypothetical protein H0T80_00370 [Betaproteobacteria bacterium]|nr:hypothetical protein [Betaproteobacteria bacterium]MBA3775234.1 hypothetical protein [Betaproteobacteria bacterium]